MTRFLFITDTHIAGKSIGFYQQPTYPDKIEELLATIRRDVEQEKIDFIIHGGDLVHQCDRPSIQEAKRLFQFSVPVHLTLGNHDLDRSDALELWLKEAPEFFVGNSPQYTVRYPSCVIHIVPNQWEPGSPYYWKHSQSPYFLQDQLEKLEEEVRSYPEAVHLLAIHNPIFGVPREQSGLDKIAHDVPADFRHIILQLMQRYPNIKGVLSGHNHINTLARTEEGIFVSGSSFVETPFEYKLVEVSEQQISIETRRVHAGLSFTPSWKEERRFVLGREQDRRLEWRFTS
ncbi:metallophosphoesterase [Paenibacillus sp. J2TS4]|uniref:metallophosphoesterase family protein n=1 Tax=Paenibacillus sp. J2TS4 TaxID=2807194 RepID=UPI001B2C3B8B|nr:metallophosphoesterase [Paenibacillus sp. J2TS4]GIP35741.1 hypothetical protein J2TS4_49510 [Paenibacillus sp. J2TS4]